MGEQFDGKVALVTGGSSGIGRAAALAFAREGARVVVADIDAMGGEETVDLVGRTGGEAHFVRADVGETDQVEALVATTLDTWGRLDFAHNNAGIEGVLARVHEYPEDLWERVLRINLTGVYLCMKYEIVAMLGQGGGAIVNTASVAGLRGSPLGAYTVSKHGVVGLTMLAAADYAQDGIRVNAVCPAFIRTPMVERGFLAAAPDRARAEARLAASQPMKRMGTPEEVAEAVIWLCSDASSFVSGVLLPIDGGAMAR